MILIPTQQIQVEEKYRDNFHQYLRDFLIGTTVIHTIIFSFKDNCVSKWPTNKKGWASLR